jgi:Tol biopolymer transport system component
MLNLVILKQNFLARAALAAVCALGCGTLLAPRAAAAGADKIAFSRGANVWTMNADGTNQSQVGAGTLYAADPSWSPDGTKLAVACGTEFWDICTMNADGSNYQALTDTRDNGRPAWSPDGKKIAFVSTRDGGSHIYLMNPDGSGVARLAVNDPNVTDEDYPAWSPDGLRIAFAGSGPAYTALYSVGVAAGDVAQLAFADKPINNPAYSPDGTMIAFDTTDAIRVVSSGGGAAAVFASAGDENDSPSWSPDGARIAFRRRVVLRDADGGVVGSEESIHVMKSDGTSEASLNAVGYAPAWRPALAQQPPPPAPTPGERVDNLIKLVNSFKLSFGPTNSLVVKLRDVSAALKAGDNGLACAKLADFVNHAGAQSGKKLTREQAEQLVNEANSIRAQLGCL